MLLVFHHPLHRHKITLAHRTHSRTTTHAPRTHAFHAHVHTLTLSHTYAHTPGCTHACTQTRALLNPYPNTRTRRDGLAAFRTRPSGVAAQAAAGDAGQGVASTFATLSRVGLAAHALPPAAGRLLSCERSPAAFPSPLTHSFTHDVGAAGGCTCGLAPGGPSAAHTKHTHTPTVADSSTKFAPVIISPLLYACSGLHSIDVFDFLRCCGRHAAASLARPGIKREIC